MKRYLLFSGSIYYPSGGFQDFISAFDTFPEAQAARQISHAEIPCGWSHIVDLHTLTILEHQEENYPIRSIP